MNGDFDPNAMTKIVNLASKYLCLQGLKVKKPWIAAITSADALSVLCNELREVYTDGDWQDFLQTSLEQAACQEVDIRADTNLFFEEWIQLGVASNWSDLFPNLASVDTTHTSKRRYDSKSPDPHVTGDPVAKSTRSGRSTPAISIEDSSSAFQK